MKNNKYITTPAVPKTETRIVLENQQSLVITSQSKRIRKWGGAYQSLQIINSSISEPLSYGPCLTYNPECSCSLEELQRQEQILKNREIEERIRREGVRINQQVEIGGLPQETIKQIQEKIENLQGQLTNLQRSFQDLQIENRNALQSLGINSLNDLPNLLNGENLTSLLSRPTQQQFQAEQKAKQTMEQEINRLTSAATEQQKLYDDLHEKLLTNLRQELSSRLLTFQASINVSVRNLRKKYNEHSKNYQNIVQNLSLEELVSKIPENAIKAVIVICATEQAEKDDKELESEGNKVIASNIFNLLNYLELIKSNWGQIPTTDVSSENNELHLPIVDEKEEKRQKVEELITKWKKKANKD